MSTTRDYYEILQVERTADAVTIKKAYRRLAHEYHPDKNPGDHEAEQKFKEASEAYQVLSDPEKRQTYDRFGHDGLRGQGYQGFNDFTDVFSSMGSIFEEIFGMGAGGGRRRRGGPQRGSDLRYDLEIPFEEAAFGVEKRIELERLTTCLKCHGKGTAEGSEPVACGMCQGMGQVRRTQGFFSVATTCPQCRGTGTIIKDPCTECQGVGKVPEKTHVSVRIPAGVEDGMRLRVGGKGEDGTQGGPAGDLYVFINVKPHEIFTRHNNDVVVQVPVLFHEVALGAKIPVPTLDGDHTIAVPPGAQHEELIRIRGKGIPHIRGYGRGDQICVLNLRVPKKLTKRQKELLEEFGKIQQEKKPDGDSSLFDRLKNLATGE